jgi:hypothetical protein
MNVGMLCAAVVFGECVVVPGSGPTPTGNVSVLALDVTGALVVNRDLEVVERGTGRVLFKGRNERISGLPYGDYTIRVVSPGFAQETRDLVIDRPEITTRLRLRMSSTGYGPHYVNLTRRMTRKRAFRELWVKATPMIGVRSNEAHVAQDGGFVMARMAHGKSIVSVVEGESLIDTRVVEVTGRGVLAINLD